MSVCIVKLNEKTSNEKRVPIEQPVAAAMHQQQPRADLNARGQVDQNVPDVNQV